MFPKVETNNNIEEQFYKIAEELDELDSELGYENNNDNIAFETYNIIQACETLLHMLPVESCVTGKTLTIEKNKERNYYER